MNTETIAAISTGLTNSGISIIRISGPEAIQLSDKFFCAAKKEKKLSDQPSHTLHYGVIKSENEIIDEVLVSVMRAPHTYTAEDVVEINCHGGALVTKKVLETVLLAGCRLAEPGEFTKRAFLNGRIDLSRAEAVMEVIHSESELALKNSVAQLQGRMQNEILSLRELILKNTAFIEAALDDPEHYSLEGYPDELKKDVTEIQNRIEMLLLMSENGKLIKDGIKTVILGKPNVGKSSLLNMLSGTERAIVTEIAGTTRDTIEESIMLKGLKLVLIDTAGLRETEDVVEKIGVERAKEAAEKADLILYVLDATDEITEKDKQIIDGFQNKKLLILMNKIDLCEERFKSDIERVTSREVIEISAKTSYGYENLSEKLMQMFFHKELSENEELYLTTERQRNALRQAKAAMNRVMESIDQGLPEDFYSIDLMDGYEMLLKITGESVEEDLVEKIFHDFCTGK